MDHRDAFVECRERSGERRSRIPLHDDGVGTLLLEGLAEPFQDPRGQPVEGLAGLDDVQVMVRADSERAVDLIDDCPVLSGQGNDGGKPRGVADRADHRCEFDRLWPGSVDDHDSFRRRLSNPHMCPLVLALCGQEAGPTVMGWNVTDASSVYRPTRPDRYGSWLSVRRTRRRPSTSTSMPSPRCWTLTVYHRPGGKTG